jgi:serine/threonine protein kinase
MPSQPIATTRQQAVIALPESTGTFDTRYSLRRLIAQSAGSEVHAAVHEFTHRPVALKIPRAGASAQAIARFEREREALAIVRGEGIVEMVDAGRVDGVPYIVFEMLDGRTLAGLVAARGQLAVPEVMEIGLEVARALERCHDRGVIHRDIKPSNLFVTSGAQREVKLLDFGISKLLDDEPRSGDKVTQENVILGTPEYMAPESLLCRPDVDHRADIYGLGVTLYECLTGSVPFDGTHGDVLSKLSSSAPQSVGELRPGLPPALVEIVSRCLARAPEDRFQTMAKLRKALERSLLEPARLPVVSLSAQPASGRDAATLADAPASRARSDAHPRRRHPRAPYTTLARIAGERGRRVDGRVEEVSEGGLQFVGSSSIPAGENVRIRFALPASGKVTEIAATSRWTKQTRGTHVTGFEFSEITLGACEELRQYAEILGSR